MGVGLFLAISALALVIAIGLRLALRVGGLREQNARLTGDIARLRRENADLHGQIEAFVAAEAPPVIEVAPERVL